MGLLPINWWSANLLPPEKLLPIKILWKSSGFYSRSNSIWSGIVGKCLNDRNFLNTLAANCSRKHFPYLPASDRQHLQSYDACHPSLIKIFLETHLLPALMQQRRKNRKKAESIFPKHFYVFVNKTNNEWRKIQKNLYNVQPAYAKQYILEYFLIRKPSWLSLARFNRLKTF